MKNVEENDITKNNESIVPSKALSFRNITIKPKVKIIISNNKDTKKKRKPRNMKKNSWNRLTKCLSKKLKIRPKDSILIGKLIINRDKSF